MIGLTFTPLLNQNNRYQKITGRELLQAGKEDKVREQSLVVSILQLNLYILLVSATSISFLAVNIQINNGKWETNLYYKPIDKYQ